MRKIIISASIVIVVVIIGFTLYFALKPKPLLLQGEIDTTEIKISSKVPGRIDKVFVKEGDAVLVDQLMISLDAPELRAKAMQAEAARRAADAQQTKAQRGARKEEIDAVFHVWQKALVAETLAEQTNKRVQQLYTEGVMSAQQRDEAQAKNDAAHKDAMAAKALYQMAIDGARPEDIASAGALADQAAGAVLEVESYLADTMLRSPIDGEVSVVAVNAGELAASGYPLITILDMSDMFATFNVREDLLPNFKMGDTIKLEIPAVGTGEYEFRISFISSRGDFSTWSATKSTGSFDLRTFEVRARPTNPIQGLRPGMSAIFFLTE